MMNWTDKDAKVTIAENKITLRTSLLIKDKVWYVELPEANSLGKVLGFDSKVNHYQVDQFGKPLPHVSEKIYMMF